MVSIVDKFGLFSIGLIFYLEYFMFKFSRSLNKI